MSYILDALRKSEAERQQGRVPDLGQQFQLIHKPPRRRMPWLALLALALTLNALVLLVWLWPDRSAPDVAQAPVQAVAPIEAPAPSMAPSTVVEGSEITPQNAAIEPEPPVIATEERAPEPVAEVQEAPTLIVPSNNPRVLPADLAQGSTSRVPHLIEMPLAFQRAVPNLVFNSHLFTSDPAGRRVIINDHYLAPGDSFAGIRVEQITSDGVVLMMHGQRFRVGVVRDWVSPR
ncbi:MAG: general secretion pathway protein GspB [Marinobacter sp.]|nr:general secretion pathway protein GspB [Marinobacter sp.]